VAAEISLSTMCLVAALLLLHGFARLMHVDKGFRSERVMLVDLNLTPQRYPDLAKSSAFVRAMLDAVASVPGIASAGVVSQPPLAGEGGNNLLFRDATATPLSQATTVDFRPSSARYFATMGVPLIRGRLFDEHDDTRRVAVISQSLAARVWPAADPIGRTFHLRSPDSPAIAVVGVVGDVRGISLSDAPTPTVYLPYWQRTFNRNRVTLALRTAADGPAADGDVRRLIHTIDPELPVPAFRSMMSVIDASTASRRFQRNLVLVFALLALLLVAVGTYGVVSYSVTQRTREIGIRVALGAVRGRVVGAVLADAMKVAGAGIVAGIPLAIAAAYSLRSLLFGVSPADAISIAGACAALGFTALAAALRPALRASRIEPMLALRQE
jgi:predicted permease